MTEELKKEFREKFSLTTEQAQSQLYIDDYYLPELERWVDKVSQVDADVRQTVSPGDVLLAENNFAILVLDSMRLKFFRNRDDFDMANQTLLENDKRLVYLKKSKNGECWIKPDDYNM